MTLKELLAKRKISQRTLADGIGLSPASINSIVNAGAYPKSLDRAKIDADIIQFLQKQGIDTSRLIICPNPKTQTLKDEESLMLLRKQTLTMTAKKHFGLFESPFTSDIRSGNELFFVK